jgi:hypothetical protein
MEYVSLARQREEEVSSRQEVYPKLLLGRGILGNRSLIALCTCYA